MLTNLKMAVLAMVFLGLGACNNAPAATAVDDDFVADASDGVQGPKLKPVGEVQTFERAQACKVGDFIKDPRTKIVIECVGSRPNEDSARCVSKKDNKCYLGTKIDGKCTPHEPRTLCPDQVARTAAK